MKARLFTGLLAVSLLLGARVCAVTNYVYVLTGQSNSLGAVKGSPASAEELARYASEGLLWSSNMERDTGKPFDAAPAWVKVQPQLPKYNGAFCMGPEYGFAHMMQRRKWHASPKSRVCVIKASLDGGGNTFWLSDKPAYKTLTKALGDGLSALEGSSQVQALLYLQGESDKGVEITKAPVRFMELKSRLQKTLKKELRYAVAGECATWHGRDEKDSEGKTTAQLMQALAQKKKEIGWVRTRDLTKITSGDSMGVHYDGRSQLSIGARYAYAVALLERLPVGCVRGDDREAQLDSPAAWWGGKLPTEADVVTWDISSFRGEEKLGKKLVVKGVRVEDPVAGEVVLSSAKGGAASPAVLAVGEGGITLEEGDLQLACELKTTADQTWSLFPGRSLKLCSLSGKGTIVLSAPPDATLELQLSRAPEQLWKLPDALPRLKATIGGKPARFVKHGSAFKLEPEAS